jgi:hypothetical protein
MVGLQLSELQCIHLQPERSIKSNHKQPEKDPCHPWGGTGVQALLAQNYLPRFSIRATNFSSPSCDGHPEDHFKVIWIVHVYIPQKRLLSPKRTIDTGLDRLLATAMIWLLSVKPGLRRLFPPASAK